MTDSAASSPEVLKQAKAALRQTILARRDAADVASRNSNSHTISQKLFALPAYRAANVVAGYASFGSEIDTSEFLARVLGEGKQLLLPRMVRAQRALELRHVIDPGADLVSGVWGIREPAERCPIMSVTIVEFMLVPGVAFTATGLPRSAHCPHRGRVRLASGGSHTRGATRPACGSSRYGKVNSHLITIREAPAFSRWRRDVRR